MNCPGGRGEKMISLRRLPVACTKCRIQKLHERSNIHLHPRFSPKGGVRTKGGDFQESSANRMLATLQVIPEDSL